MEKVIELKLGVTPEAAISGAVLLQSEYTTYLTFNAMKNSDKPSPYGGFYKDDAGTAIIKFDSCLITKFGHPNDEAAWNIPRLSDTSYGIYEVKNSNWVRSLEEDNNHSFPGTDYSCFRHFLMCFHDSTFECVASDLELKISNQPYSEIISELGSKIAAE